MTSGFTLRLDQFQLNKSQEALTQDTGGYSLQSDIPQIQEYSYLITRLPSTISLPGNVTSGGHQNESRIR